MDTLFSENYNPEEDTKAIKNIGASAYVYVQEVYQSPPCMMPYFPLQPQQPQQHQQPSVFVPCKHFNDVVRQNTGASYVHFWAVIENVLTVLKLSPDVETQYRSFADRVYRKKNPNAR